MEPWQLAFRWQHIHAHRRVLDEMRSRFAESVREVHERYSWQEISKATGISVGTLRKYAQLTEGGTGDAA